MHLFKNFVSANCRQLLFHCLSLDEVLQFSKHISCATAKVEKFCCMVVLESVLYMLMILALHGERPKVVQKQGWIHSNPSLVQMGRGSDREGHWGIWVGAVKSKHSNVEPTEGWTKLSVLSSQIKSFYLKTSIYFENVLLLDKQSYCL